MSACLFSSRAHLVQICAGPADAADAATVSGGSCVWHVCVSRTKTDLLKKNVHIKAKKLFSCLVKVFTTVSTNCD